ncbi:MAG: ribosomal protein S18-alanine N-acetyltransferase [Bacillota bacterium]|jgi:ribosomal-protein-alanine N-acetyltransferase
MTIRPATMQDLATILKIENLSFASPWTEAHFQYELKENPYAFMFVAEAEGHVVGYIDFWITFQQAQINNIAVIPALRHQGIGRVILMDAIQRIAKAGCETITLEVRVSNHIAQKLYAKHGFKALLKKPHYYADGEDALLMEKRL